MNRMRALLAGLYGLALLPVCAEPLDTLSELIGSDDHRHAIIDGLGWRDRPTRWRDDRPAGIQRWDALLDELAGRESIGVLDVEAPGLVELLWRLAAGTGTRRAKPQLEAYLLIAGRNRLQQLDPWLAGLRDDLRWLRARRRDCPQSGADLDRVQALVEPHLSDDFERTLLVQMMLVLDYDVSAYAAEFSGTPGLPAAVAAELRSIAEPGDCLMYGELAGALFRLQQVLPVASQARWDRQLPGFEQGAGPWFEIVIAELDPARVMATEMAARRRLLERLLAQLASAPD